MRRRRRQAPATTALIVIIIAVFVLEVATGFDLARRFAIVPEAVKGGQYWRLLTGIFLHAGAVHLLLNVFALFQLGRFYELMFGSQRFLLIYFATGIAGSVASSLFNDGWSVGASGAILGILGAFIFSVRNSPRWRHDAMGRSIVSQGMFWIVANIVITWTIPQIDKAGHIGGLLTGLILGAVLPHRVPPPPPAEMVVDVTPYGEPDEDPAARRDDRSPLE
jgi:rhomboid protease GluP